MSNKLKTKGININEILEDMTKRIMVWRNRVISVNNTITIPRSLLETWFGNENYIGKKVDLSLESENPDVLTIRPSKEEDDEES